MMMVPDSAVTHGGRFHADDVFSSALLRLLNPKIEIRRVMRLPEKFHGFAFDIGGGDFDHHQKGAPVRENGVPYAAFGLLWRAFGGWLITDSEECARFDQHFIQPLDLDDNTGCGSETAALIALFNPGWDSREPADKCFWDAVSFAQVILEKRLESVRSMCRARGYVEEALRSMEHGVVTLEQFAPWKAVLPASDAQFVVYPSQRGGYSAQGVPADDETHALKVPFPAEWAGRGEEELPGLSGCATVRFCHNNRFLIAAGTHADAVAACHAAQKICGQTPG